MKKSIKSIIVTALVMMLVICASVICSAAYSDGSIEWTIEDGIVSMQSAENTSGNLTIDFGSTAWNNFKKSISSTIVEINAVNVDGRGVITAIKGPVKWEYTSLEKITFPSTVTNIFAASANDYVFSDNKVLTTFGPTGTEKGTLDLSGITDAWSEWGWNERYAFTNTAFKKVILPANVPSTIGIGNGMFKGCTALREVVIPASVGSISTEAFSGCTSLKTVHIYGKPSVDATSFTGCGALKVYNYGGGTISNLPVGSSVISIYSDGIVEWTFENGIVSMQSAEGTSGNITLNFGSSAWISFKNVNASSIKEINAVNVDGRGVITAISGGVNWSFTVLEKITFPSTVTNIFAGNARNYMFADNHKLSTFGPTGTEKGTLDLSGITAGWSEWGWEERQAFMNAAFKKIILPSNVSSKIGIGDQMFMGCTALTEVIIPACFGSISSSAFGNCTALKNVRIYGTPSIDASSFSGCLALKVYLYASSEIDKANFPAGTEFIDPPKVQSAMVFDGFKVRVSDYNGLRSIFYFNNDLKEQEGFSLVEYGAFVISSEGKANNAPEIVYENGKSVGPVGGTHFVIYNALTDTYGKILSPTSADVDPTLNATYFALSVVRFNEQLLKDMYFAGYEIWKNEATGELEIIYTDYASDEAHDKNFVETSIYEVSLSMLKNGFLNSTLDSSNIVWDILVKGGAVTLYGGSDYAVKENMTDLSGNPIGNEFKFAGVPAVNQTLNGNVLEFTATDVNITLLRDGDEYIAVYRGEGSIPTANRWGTGTFCQLSDNFCTDPNSKGFTVSNAVPNPVLSYNVYKNIKTVIIDEGVTEIGSQHFSYMNYLTTIVYPDSLTKIGSAAFQGCGSLKTAFKAYTRGTENVVDLSYVNELSVGNLFNGCSGIKYVRLPETITSIGYEMFQNCSALVAVVCGEGEFTDGTVDLENSMIDTISDRAFKNDGKLTSFILPATVANIYGAGADASFYGCSAESGIVKLYTNEINEVVNAYALMDEFQSYIEYSHN